MNIDITAKTEFFTQQHREVEALAYDAQALVEGIDQVLAAVLPTSEPSVLRGAAVELQHRAEQAMKIGLKLARASSSMECEAELSDCLSDVPRETKPVSRVRQRRASNS